MGNERFTPHLVMFRRSLTDLEPLRLACGYRLRHFRAGDEAAWERIINAAYETESERFDNRFKSHAIWQPQRVLFIVDRYDEPVATAAAWQIDRFGDKVGCLHMVGVHPRHQGRGLGCGISLAVLRQFARMRLKAAALNTHDYRLPAIGMYLKLGFEPVLVHENQRQRWRRVLSALSPDGLLERRFDHVLTGPLQQVTSLVSEVRQ